MQKVVTINNNIDINEEVKLINPDKIDFSNKEVVRNIIVFILNIIEQLLHLNQQLKEENQKMKDEINYLKGEKSQPKFNGCLIFIPNADSSFLFSNNAASSVTNTLAPSAIAVAMFNESIGSALLSIVFIFSTVV